MNHLSEIGMSYFTHLIRAVLFAFETFVTSVIMLIHGVLPFLFCKTGSNRIADMYYRIKAGDHASERILVWYNTEFNLAGRNWIVYVKGQETLVCDVVILVPTETIIEPSTTGEVKCCFLCWGTAKFVKDHTAIIE